MSMGREEWTLSDSGSGVAGRAEAGSGAPWRGAPAGARRGAFLPPPPPPPPPPGGLSTTLGGLVGAGPRRTPVAAAPAVANRPARGSDREAGRGSRPVRRAPPSAAPASAATGSAVPPGSARPAAPPRPVRPDRRAHLFPQPGGGPFPALVAPAWPPLPLRSGAPSVTGCFARAALRPFHRLAARGRQAPEFGLRGLSRLERTRRSRRLPAQSAPAPPFPTPAPEPAEARLTSASRV